NPSATTGKTNADKQPTASEPDAPAADDASKNSRQPTRPNGPGERLRFAEVELPDGSTLRTENEGLAVWTEYPGNEDGGNQAWFDFRHHAIVVKNPDQDILTKMLEIAARLNAKVIGDEGEEYKAPTDHGVLPAG
ncbi:hypothetical protein, partial [Rhodopirellula bahusiensis]